MRNKNLFFILGICAVLAYAGVVQAAWTTDPDVGVCSGQYDIAAAKVETWPCTPQTSATNEICDLYPQVGKVGIQMATGSTLPGILLLELDVDNDPLTGGTGGMTGIFGACTDFPNDIKNHAGMDIAIIIALRSQAKTGATAPTFGVYKCAQLGAPCGGGGSCFSVGLPCTGTSLYADNCYEINDNNYCGTGGASCYTMDANHKCEKEMLQSISTGEWFATLSSGGITGPVSGFLSGNIEQGYIAELLTGVCVPLPFSKIIKYAKAEGGTFDETASLNPANWRWVVSGWKNLEDADDFIVFRGPGPLDYCTAVCDAVPSALEARQPVTVLAEGYCLTDSNGDGKINTTDLGSIKKDFLNQKCPCQKLVE